MTGVSGASSVTGSAGSRLILIHGPSSVPHSARHQPACTRVSRDRVSVMTRAIGLLRGDPRVDCGRERGFSHIHVKGLFRKGLEARFRADDPMVGLASPEKSQRQRCVEELAGAGLAGDVGAIGAADDAAGGAVLAADAAVAGGAAAVPADAGCAACHASSSAESYQWPACLTIGHSPVSV